MDGTEDDAERVAAQSLRTLQTSADRTLVYRPNLPKDATPVAPGWCFSTLVLLPDPVSSWTYVLDNRRVPSSATADTIGLEQLDDILPLLPPRFGRPILVLDRHYSSAPWVLRTVDLPCDQLIRARRDRVLYRPRPAPSGKRGAPRKDGALPGQRSEQSWPAGCGLEWE